MLPRKSNLLREPVSERAPRAGIEVSLSLLFAMLYLAVAEADGACCGGDNLRPSGTLRRSRRLPPSNAIPSGPRPVGEQHPIHSVEHDALVPNPRQHSAVPELGAGSKRRERVRPISMLLIDDNRLVRIGLSTLIRRQGGLRLLASMGLAEAVLQPADAKDPDVILLDAGQGECGCQRAVREIRAKYSDSKLILMGLLPVEHGILDLVKEGVAGFVLKAAPIGEFIACVRVVASGQRVFP